ncbi:hypothetical protein [Spiroplasma endosymbiont of 'Nebria riversi']|uniref:hypothetical protein n=1 Tax=Spiroplasma endosymbiont of 'Nebria riversi' TaxID=2792084 RepID=UPI001C04AE89|nr:hypothetical protein [Spiroplasma endosymbiont of 'Nebria riversi']
MFLVVWKDLDWEMTKFYFWDLFIQITTIPAWVSGKEIDLTKELLWLLIANIAFWMVLVVIVLFKVILFYKVKLYFVYKGGDYMIGTFLVDAPAKITGEQVVTNLWKALITAFGNIWTDIIGGNMPNVINFFATYWVFLLGVIIGLFLIAFKMFEKLIPGR